MTFFTSAPKPVPVERMILTRWGMMTRADIIQRLCTAFPGDIEAILGLAELNPDKWPHLEIVDPATNEVVSYSGRPILITEKGPKYQLIWIDI